MQKLKFRNNTLVSYAIVIELFLIILLPFTSYAQGIIFKEYEVKAAFVERFTRFIDWPASSQINDINKSFIVGIIGKHSDNLILIEKLSMQKIKGKKIELKEITRRNEITDCHLIYICEEDEHFINEVLSYTLNKPILTISDNEELSYKNALITLFIQSDHVYFEVNKKAIEQSGLYFSSLLLNLSRQISTEEN